jgi:peptidylprolyl isomerase/peptidyl-prolyl cis-trans isomerase B (cyclophilin B)
MRKKQNFIWRGVLLCLCAILFVVIVGCSQQKQVQTQEREQLPEKKIESKTKEDVAVEDNKIAAIETNKGTIKFEFYPKEAPKTVENFIKLANKGFYDGTKFHRVVSGFVIQGGDPNSKDDNPANDGKGGPGYTIEAEFNEHKHLDRAVAMARSSDPNSAGSQFYICLDAQPNLDGQYTVFGQVTEGLEVVHKIEQNDVMKKVYIEEK